MLRKAAVSVGKLDRDAGGAGAKDLEPAGRAAQGSRDGAGRDGAERGETMNSGLGTDR